MQSPGLSVCVPPLARPHLTAHIYIRAGKQLKPVIEAYYGPDAGRRTCKQCGWVEQVPEKFRQARERANGV